MEWSLISWMGLSANATETEIKSAKNSTRTSVRKYPPILTLPALAIIPAGTSNGLAESLGWSDPYLAVKGLIENEVRHLDALEITTMEGPGDTHSKIRWDLHSVNWGLLLGYYFWQFVSLYRWCRLCTRAPNAMAPEVVPRLLHSYICNATRKGL